MLVAAKATVLQGLSGFLGDLLSLAFALLVSEVGWQWTLLACHPPSEMQPAMRQ
jgi:hypothetical protein